jgi:hypothetical protein
MMTAAHLAHRYLLGDPDIQFLIDNCLLKSKIKLDPDGGDFIFHLYQASCKYVHSMRDCCQFNHKDRHDIAIKALTILYKEKKGQLKQPYDDNYAFINALVQSAAFKKLHHEYYNDLGKFYESSTNAIDLKVIIKKFFASFIVNKDNWYQQLMNAVNEQEEFKNNPLDQFCRASQLGLNEEQQKVSITDRRKLLTDLIETMNDLSLKFPTAEYSQPFSKAVELCNSAALYTP